MSLLKEKPLRRWLEAREPLLPRKKLVDLIHKGNPDRDYACPKCVIESPEEFAKYAWTIRKGQIRPKLEYITPTLLRCPKCKTQYFTEDFFSQVDLSSADKAREQAEALSSILKSMGFKTKITAGRYPPELGVGASFAVVDFYDPELRRMLIRAGAPYDREKAEIHAESIEGSVDFDTVDGGPVDLEGHVVVSGMRPPLARGELTERVEIPPDIRVEEVHWHTEDGLLATHFHMTGVDVNVTKLAKFIGKLRDVSKEFILKRRGLYEHSRRLN